MNPQVEMAPYVKMGVGLTSLSNHAKVTTMLASFKPYRQNKNTCFSTHHLVPFFFLIFVLKNKKIMVFEPLACRGVHGLGRI